MQAPLLRGLPQLQWTAVLIRLRHTAQRTGLQQQRSLQKPSLQVCSLRLAHCHHKPLLRIADSIAVFQEETVA